MKRLATLCVAGMLLAQAGSAVLAADTGPELKSIGPMAFAPKGVLLIGDPKQAAVFAVETGDMAKADKMAPINIEGLGEKLADMLGTKASDIQVKDLAINPLSGTAYLGVHRGRGPEATPVVLKIAGSEITEFAVKEAKFTKAALTNAPKDAGQGRRNRRTLSITDIAFSDGQVIVAGLSNEEFASKLRVMDFPFKSVDAGTSVEVYHGAHGKLETRSPVRTFIPFKIDDKPHLLAAYTCTPLVKFPVTDLVPGKKIQGTTIAELGAGNHPLDMVTYEKDGKNFLLIANSRRGIMKVDTAQVSGQEAITSKVARGKTAGIKYETIKDWKGVVQLEQLDAKHACLVIDDKDASHLKTVALP